MKQILGVGRNVVLGLRDVKAIEIQKVILNNALKFECYLKRFLISWKTCLYFEWSARLSKVFKVSLERGCGWKAIWPHRTGLCVGSVYTDTGAMEKDSCRGTAGHLLWKWPSWQPCTWPCSWELILSLQFNSSAYAEEEGSVFKKVK